MWGNFRGEIEAVRVYLGKLVETLWRLLSMGLALNIVIMD